MKVVTRGRFRQAWVALRAMVILTVVLGIGYTALITAIGQLALPAQANGSLIVADGKTVGSSLIGQSFTNSRGVALPEWFQSRPSASGYDATTSGGSNRGPDSAELRTAIEARKVAIENSDGVTASQVPADSVTASGSGLDPDISPAYALIQVNRVADARGLAVSTVKKLVESKIRSRELGYLGEPTINVLELNIALAKLR